jgi:tyrosine-protein phosphatase SIW14
MRLWTSLIMAAFVLALAGNASPQETKRETFPGLVNYFRIDATASNGSQFQSRDLAIPELAKRGFKAVINVAGGPDAEAEGEAVRKAGMKYFVMTIGVEGSPGQYDPAKIDPILKTMSDPANQPVFLHSGNGHRTAMLWMIKRVEVDGWSIERAGAEATTIGLIDNNPMVPVLWKFAQDYINAHPKTVSP